ncbi:MAG: hypothetical protein HQM10_06590 [Candidatus Riflebacteria bacterium]|nr:hypothetical protein [Candidatus Riflebacteria bacterium]
MNHQLLLSALVLVPFAAGIISQIFSTPGRMLYTSTFGVLITAVIGCFTLHETYLNGSIFGFSKWLFMDALSAYHLSVLLIIYVLSSLFSLRYFDHELKEKNFRLVQARLFAGLWSPSLGAMILVLVSNNMGIMWVAMETTTLMTTFLICIHLTRDSLEAMWKYLLICSVGIAFAFMGTLLLRLSAKDLGLNPNEALLWTNLLANAKSLVPALVKAAFIFAIVGYGTKAGLAPMHTWLPDAHSKAPAPVSAVFSGFMLNTALYCIMRFIPITETATGGTGWSLRFLIGFGLFSITLSSAFILYQHDLKRLLAYCSLEHLGIIALGIGIGDGGTFAALFHTFNHSLCKSLSFFAAGRLGQIYQTHDMEKMTGSIRVSPVWGIGIFASILALIGLPPFSIFMSEFQLLKAAVDKGQIGVVILFILGTGIVFTSVLKHILPIAWGEPTEKKSHSPDLFSSSIIDIFLVVVPLATLVVLGIWMPEPFQAILTRSAGIIQNVQIIGSFK